MQSCEGVYVVIVFLGEAALPTLKFEWISTVDNRVIPDMANFQGSSESLIMNGRF